MPVSGAINRTRWLVWTEHAQARTYTTGCRNVVPNALNSQRFMAIPRLQNVFISIISYTIRRLFVGCRDDCFHHLCQPWVKNLHGVLKFIGRLWYIFPPIKKMCRDVFNSSLIRLNTWLRYIYIYEYIYAYVYIYKNVQAGTTTDIWQVYQTFQGRL